MEDTCSRAQVKTTCPSCGGHALEVVVTVDSGAWERQFLQCQACCQALVSEWSNTHLPEPVTSLATCSL